MKNLLLLCCLFPCYIFSQDVIIKTNGDEIISKVIEVDTDKIKYKKIDNLEGPVYSISFSEVFIIKYANGAKDIISNLEKKTSFVETAKHDITGTWTNKLISAENIRINREESAHYITLKGSKISLAEIKVNEYALEGSSIRVYAINKDSLYFKDIDKSDGYKLYLVRTSQPEIDKAVNSSKGIVGIGASTGIGASYAGGGVNAALRIGSENFSIRPNLGLGVYFPTIDETLPVVYGAKLYFGNSYIGYRYGYLGTTYYEDYYYNSYTGSYEYYYDYFDAYGSVLVFGYDLCFGKRKNFFLTSGFGINISGIELEYNDSNFDLGLGVQF